MTQYSKIILRISMALIFLWFGLNQLFDTSSWIGYVPTFALNFSFSAYSIVFINGFFETLFGSFLIIGFYPRLSALLLGLHLFAISLGLGYNALMVRDIGLALATISIAFEESDSWCIDKRLT